MNVRIPGDLKAALKSAAEDDMRSLSSLVEKILVEWVRARGGKVEETRRSSWSEARFDR